MSLEGIVGATIGFFVGGPQGAMYGYSLGSALGAEGPPDQSGPRLTDLRVQSSAYGAPMPIIYGKARVAGNVIWAKPIRERKIEEDSGSKGGSGSTVTTYEYYGTFAVALCDNEIAGVRKIWADSKLIYNLDVDGIAASIAGVPDAILTILEVIQASNRQSEKITIHYGTETQQADSLIQADKGAANTQAYRGTAYIVFDDILLEDFGNRIPNITAEVVSTASSSIRRVLDDDVSYLSASYPTQVTYVDDLATAYVFEMNGGFGSGSGTYTYYKHFSNGLVEEIGTRSAPYGNAVDPNYGHGDKPFIVWRGSVFNNEKCKIDVFDDHFNFVYRGQFDNRSDDLGGSFDPSNTEVILLDGYFFALVSAGATSATRLQKISEESMQVGGLIGAYPKMEVINDSTGDMKNGAVSLTYYNSQIYVLNNDDTIQIFDTDGTLSSTISFSPSPALAYEWGFNEPSLRVEGDTIYIVEAENIHKIEDGTYSFIGNTQTQFATGVEQNQGGRYIRDGVLYYFVPPSIHTPGFYWAFHLDSLTAGTVTLSSIVSDLDERAGLDAADDDTSALTDTVEGYVVTRPMSARKAIEPLQKAFFFDACEKDNVLTYVKRGGSVVANIPEVDLGAGDYGQDVDLFTLNRQQDSELPAEIVVDYIDLNRSYQEGAQRAQRINSPQENVVKVSLPIVGVANYFKEVAHILLYNAHTEREKFKLSLTGEYIDLNPTDVITFTADGDTRKVRITKITYGDTLMLEAVAEDVTVYSAESVAGDSEITEQSLGLEGPTKLYLMDIPLLRNQDNDAGMYVAASGYFSAWTGAGIFKSLDGGISYSPVQDVLAASAMGKATTALADANHTTFDRTSTVTVSLTSGTLSSSTESAVIQGANYALLGTEIIQFVNATDNGDGTYTLDTLLRGRRGTDWATGTHAVGDLFCLLRENVLERLGAVVNTERYYKAVTFGTYLDEAAAQTKTNSGVSQKPFSVKYIAHTRNGSNDIALSWTRRSRYIGTPLWKPPVFEDSESYKIEVLSGAGGSVVNTYTSTSPSYTYTNAQQTADGFTPGNTIYFNIYQVGAVDGYDTEYEAA